MKKFIFIFGAKYLIAVSVLIFIWWCFTITKDERKRMAIYILGSFVLSFLLAKLGNVLIHDPRPFVVNHTTPLIPHAADNGFPSDHALLAGAIAAVVSMHHRRWGLILWVVAFFIGISRVFVQVHHLSDVLGSFIIAVLSTALVFTLQKRFQKKNTNDILDA